MSSASFSLDFLDRHGIHGFVPRRRAVFTHAISITIACFLGVVKHVQGTNHPVGRDLFWHRADADPAIAVFPEPMRQLRDARSCGWTLIFLLAWSPPCAAAEVAGLGADAAEMQRRNRTWYAMLAARMDGSGVAPLGAAWALNAAALAPPPSPAQRVRLRSA